MFLLPLEKGSSRGDQIENAKFFTEEGAAVTLAAKDATPAALCCTLTRLLENSEDLKAMAQASAALADEKPAVKIAHLLQQWITE